MASVPNKFINFAVNAKALQTRANEACFFLPSVVQPYTNNKDLWQILIGLKSCWRKRNAPTRSWRRYLAKTLLPFQSGVPTTHNPTFTPFRRLQQSLMLTSASSSIIQSKERNMTTKIKSPYSAAVTGGGFLYEETVALMPLLQSPDKDRLLREEAVNNAILHVNAETSRKRFVAEIHRRYMAMPVTFWNEWMDMDEENRKAALFMVILKTYKILFDLHVNVTLHKWNSASRSVDRSDLMMEFDEISSKDAFVDSWTENTKKKVAAAYLSILRKVKMLDTDNQLHPLHCTNYEYYLTHGEAWFLEACLLQPYEIADIKKKALKP